MNKRNKVKIVMNIYNPNRTTGCYSGLVYDPQELAPTLNTMQGGGRMPFILLSYDKGQIIRGDNGGIKFTGKLTEIREDRCCNTVSTILKDNPIMEAKSEYNEIELRPDSSVTPLGNCRYDIDGREIEFRIRKLSPRECYRLMDVPDNVIDTMMQCDENGKQLISNSQHYRMAGNSIVTSCLLHIYEQIWYPKASTNLTPKQLSLF